MQYGIISVIYLPWYDVSYQRFIIIYEPVLKFVSLWTEFFLVKHATFAICGYEPMLTNGKAILRKPVEFNCE